MDEFYFDMAYFDAAYYGTTDAPIAVVENNRGGALKAKSFELDDEEAIALHVHELAIGVVLWLP